MVSNKGKAVMSIPIFPANSTLEASEFSPASRQESAANCTAKHIPRDLKSIIAYSPGILANDIILFILFNTGEISVKIAIDNIIPAIIFIITEYSGRCFFKDTAATAALSVNPAIAHMFIVLTIRFSKSKY